MNAPGPEHFWATLNLDRAAPLPLQQQLYDQIRGAIRSGAVMPGSRFPASRVLAAEVGCSRNTVMEVLARLVAEGYAASVRGSGTFVETDVPDATIEAARPASTARGEAVLDESAPGLSLRGERAAATRVALPSAAHTAFMPSMPDVSIFPLATWVALHRREWLAHGAALVAETDVRGYEPLRAAIAEYVRIARGIVCELDQIFIVAGAQQGIDVTARLLLDPGDVAWVEDPGYPPVAALFRAAGANVVPVPLDAAGLAFDTAAHPVPRAIAVSPSNQFPSGIMMSLERRLALLDYAEYANAWILEDDYDSEFRYEGHPVAALASLSAAAADRVVYIGTFSKMLFPAIRLGFVIVPKRLVRTFARGRRALDLQPSIAAQPALAAFIAEGHLATHVRRMRHVYRGRRDALVDALGAQAGELLRASRPQAGMQLVAHFTPGLARRFDAARAAELARSRGLNVQPLSLYAAAGSAADALVLGYACVDDAALRAGVTRLCEVLSP